MLLLANVLLRTQGKNELLVAATDFDVSLTAELSAFGGVRAAAAPERRPGAMAQPWHIDSLGTSPSPARTTALRLALQGPSSPPGCSS